MEDIKSKAANYAEKRTYEILKKAISEAYADGYADGYKDREKEIPFEEEIGFIKQSILGVNKHHLFSYLAVLNNLIGEVRWSKEIKEKWLDRPEKYLFRLIDSEGVISGEYSTDGGNSYNSFYMPGDSKNLDDVSKFTYQLFKEMGVLTDFKLNGHKAVDFINLNRILSL